MSGKEILNNNNKMSISRKADLLNLDLKLCALMDTARERGGCDMSDDCLEGLEGG